MGIKVSPFLSTKSLVKGSLEKKRLRSFSSATINKNKCFEQAVWCFAVLQFNSFNAGAHSLTRNIPQRLTYLRDWSLEDKLLHVLITLLAGGIVMVNVVGGPSEKMLKPGPPPKVEPLNPAPVKPGTEVSGFFRRVAIPPDYVVRPSSVRLYVHVSDDSYSLSSL